MLGLFFGIFVCLLAWLAFLTVLLALCVENPGGEAWSQASGRGGVGSAQFILGWAGAHAPHTEYASWYRFGRAALIILAIGRSLCIYLYLLQ